MLFVRLTLVSFSFSDIHRLPVDFAFQSAFGCFKLHISYGRIVLKKLLYVVKSVKPLQRGNRRATKENVSSSPQYPH